MRSKAVPTLQIAYDSTPIPEAANYKHVGIIQSISGKYPNDIYAVKQTIKGSLCHALTGEPCHMLFILRLCQFDLCEDRKIRFIPDIVKILQKYHLEDYLTNFKTNSLFPSKEKWKSVCRKAVRQHETSHWRMRLEQHNDFSLFKEVHTGLEPATIWRVAKIRTDSLSLMKFLSRLCCKQPPEQRVLCLKCTHQYMHIEVVLALFVCPLTDSPKRLQTFLETVRPLNAPLHEHLKKSEPATLVLYLMGMSDDVIADFMPLELYPKFLMNCVNFLQSVLGTRGTVTPRMSSNPKPGTSKFRYILY
ncbi:hypothetical protein DPMN_100020 [Dreissena polymorpha]|uniref:Uncharacterized protein n=1 Tax=Dreissena polymorpha TaxID=45954 RepID=A0A9D4R7T5_DREPO|nr:hypothetical protein DPMN_100020 [Dreissena polymorpha]